jgi:uncharacterized protein (TIGR03086 family)
MRGSRMREQDTRQGFDLSAAFESTMSVLRKVGPADLDKPTPCASWDVRALINHFVSSARWWARLVSGGDGLAGPDGPDGPDDVDHVAGDFVAAYEESIRISSDTFGAEGVAERIVTVPFGDFPGAVLQGFAATEQFAHGWDLARALGHDTDLAPELALAQLALSEVSIDDSMRGPDAEAPFGPVHQAPAGSSPADRLAAFLGREV